MAIPASRLRILRKAAVKATMIPQPCFSPAYQSAVAPALSVIIPTCNRSAAIADLLASIAAQTTPRARYEILIIDDGSDEEHCAALARLAQKSGREGLPLAIF